MSSKTILQISLKYLVLTNGILIISQIFLTRLKTKYLHRESELSGQVIIDARGFSFLDIVSLIIAVLCVILFNICLLKTITFERNIAGHTKATVGISKHVQSRLGNFLMLLAYVSSIVLIALYFDAEIERKLDLLSVNYSILNQNFQYPSLLNLICVVFGTGGLLFAIIASWLNIRK